MKKLLGVLIAVVCTGCFSHTRSLRTIEAPDSVVGDLHCAAPRLSLIEALYFDPSVPLQCESRD